MKSIPDLDAVIVGGGIAGLWLANRLQAQGRRVILLEAEALGCQQTLASQGMIHGGLKYALGGTLSGASEAIASMPERWRACLAGTGELDLRGLEPLCEDNLLFADGSAQGRFTTFFASKALQGRIRRLGQEHWPEALSGCTGWVYALNDLVLDTPALIDKLAAGLHQSPYRYALQAGEICPDTGGWTLNLAGERLFCRELVLCAGEGNEALLHGLGADSPRMQRRGLRQVIVRSEQLTPLYGHCLTGIRSNEPRLTITSHRDGNGWLWYLGGRLAGADADISKQALCDFARQELRECLPWLSFDSAEFSVLDIDRAEVASAGQRPDQFFVQRAIGRRRTDRATDQATDHPGAIVCWPTKLTLAPAAADRVLELMAERAKDQPRGNQNHARLADINLPNARLGSPGWTNPHNELQ